MSKNQFRVLILASLLLSITGGVYDYMWPDTISEQIIEYAHEIEPEIRGMQLAVLAVVGVAALILTVVSLIGLLLFKSWARPMYIAGFVLLILLYPFMGVSVYSGVGLIFYDLSMIASGVVLAMLYFSPVSKFYRRNGYKLMQAGSRNRRLFLKHWCSKKREIT